MTKHYPDVDSNPNFPDLEKEILSFWQSERIFERSVEQRPKTCEPGGERAISPRSGVPSASQQASAGTNNEFVFYDGPPFANGLPHYGHLLTGYVKDAIARYQTMRGKRVERRFGWDCHGLPAEMGSEKELGISGRQAIQNFGIEKFNEHCRTSVMKYTSEWEDYVNRQARWVDFKNDYKTMDKNFMESVLWAFKQLYDKGLVYEAYRVMPYSWAAETPLSNFETKLDNSYREREDKAITVAFELEQEAGVSEKCYILAWTTTPWTLPSNLALAVSTKMQYVSFVSDGVRYIVGKTYYDKNYQGGNIGTIKIPTDSNPIELDGHVLIGKKYKPLFPYFASQEHKQVAINAFRILDGSNFVIDGDGTGIVHMAPGFGEDDFNLCLKHEIGYYETELKGLAKALATGIDADLSRTKFVCPVDGQGKYTDEIFDIAEPPLKLKGLNVIAQTEGQCEAEPYKPEQLKKYGLANLRIIQWLKMTGNLIKQEDFKHNYPHCWRTDQPLIYRAMPSWYVEVTKFRDRAVEVNKTINWIPEHIRDGQMAHMLATAPDWSISRNRFWGTPIPVWRSKSGKVIVIGSIAELEELSGKKVADLHRPYIDDITITKDGETYTRVEDVFDCWFESGSMPFAQVHYPFENKEWFHAHFPADFITEYVGQTRGWFNTLIMLSTALFDCAPFKNCICHGVVLDSETGNKYSKRLKNYKDPMEVMDKYGADALRWLMLASPVMRGADLSVDPDGKFIRDVVRLAIKPIWNAYNFFSMYANADGIKAEHSTTSTDIMDRYILAKCASAVEQIKTSLDAYDTPGGCEAVTQFFEVLNNWYIRRSKERFWKEEKDADKQAAYNTLYTVLTTMCQAAAPLLPLTLDDIYKGLTGKESVHLAEFPDCHAAEWRHPDPAIQRDDSELIAQMDWVQDVCNAALAIRNRLNIRVRQPLNDLQIVWDTEARIHFAKRAQTDAHLFLNIIREEVNVKTITLSDQSKNPLRALAEFKLSINSAVLGKILPDKMKQILPASKKGDWKQVNGKVEVAGVILPEGSYTLQLEPKPEYKDRAQALSTNDALVILDTNVTEDLKREGLARDLVRAIQQARKDAGLHVADRIHLGVEGNVAEVLADNALTTYIKEQTLATVLNASPLPTKTFETKAELDDISVTITLAKAA